MLIEFIRGVYPYPASTNILEMIENVRNGIAPSLPSELYAADLVDLIARCLEKNPNERSTVVSL